jgi:3-hydroxyacyl-[acyl-carrier-protein] dehydratase
LRWQLLRSIDEVVPGERIAGRASTAFPDELFGDHFPSYPVTPGVLLVELGAQIAGFLVQATVYEQSGLWVFPVLSIIREAKFRTFVPPHAEVRVEAKLVSLYRDYAAVRAGIAHDGVRCVSMELALSFDAEGEARMGDAGALVAYSRSELDRLASPWRPREET